MSKKENNNKRKKIVSHVSSEVAKKIMLLAFEQNVTRDRLIREIVEEYFGVMPNLDTPPQVNLNKTGETDNG